MLTATAPFCSAGSVVFAARLFRRFPARARFCIGAYLRAHGPRGRPSDLDFVAGNMLTL